MSQKPLRCHGTLSLASGVPPPLQQFAFSPPAATQGKRQLLLRSLEPGSLWHGVWHGVWTTFWTIWLRTASFNSLLCGDKGEDCSFNFFLLTSTSCYANLLCGSPSSWTPTITTKCLYAVDCVVVRRWTYHLTPWFFSLGAWMLGCCMWLG